MLNKKKMTKLEKKKTENLNEGLSRGFQSSRDVLIRRLTAEAIDAKRRKGDTG